MCQEKVYVIRRYQFRLPTVVLLSRVCCRLHRRQSTTSPHLAFELRPLRISDDGELLKPDGMLSEDDDAALRRTIAALVLNLRGIDPDLRESGLDVLCGLATRRCPSHISFFLQCVHVSG